MVQSTFYRFNKLSNKLLLLTKKVPLQLCSIVNFYTNLVCNGKTRKMKKKTTSSSYEILVNEMRHEKNKQTLDD